MTATTPHRTHLWSGHPAQGKVVVIMAALAALTVAIALGLWLLLDSSSSHTGTGARGGVDRTQTTHSVQAPAAPADLCRPTRVPHFC